MGLDISRVTRKRTATRGPHRKDRKLSCAPTAAQSRRWCRPVHAVVLPLGSPLLSLQNRQSQTWQPP